MKRMLLGLMLLMTAGAASAAERFTCQYVTKIKAVNLSGKAPKAEVSTIKERYAFYVDPTGKASYVNLETGSKDDITAERFGAGWHFSELPSKGDNLFLVTIFTTKTSDGTFPSLWSFHAWKDIDFYAPTLSYGYCR